jgi:hypothetical protein
VCGWCSTGLLEAAHHLACRPSGDSSSYVFDVFVLLSQHTLFLFFDLFLKFIWMLVLYLYSREKLTSRMSSPSRCRMFLLLVIAKGGNHVQ